MYKNLLDQLVLRQRNRAQLNIRKWRSALRTAEDIRRPRRSLLQEVYEEILLDTHIRAELQKRVLHLTGRKGHLVNGKGEIAAEATTLLQRPWFSDFIKHVTEAKFKGCTLLHLGPVKDREISGIQLIPRAHHVPQQGYILKHETDEKGIEYREDKGYKDWLIEVGEPHELGILNACVPHALYKRFAESSWSEFNELFVMPLRVAKTNTNNEASFRRLENMMVQMMQGSWAVIDKDEEIEFISEKNSHKGESFHSLINLCNAEISKVFTLAVIGEASQGGSRSKEEVGERLMNLALLADERTLANVINYQLLPLLQMKEYPVKGLQWKWEQTKDLKDLWDIANGLLLHKDIDNEWLSETFGMPVKDKPADEPGEPAKLSIKKIAKKLKKQLSKPPKGEDPFFG